MRDQVEARKAFRSITRFAPRPGSGQQAAPFFLAISEVLSQDYIRQLRHKHVHDSYDLLTEREKEVLQLIAEGKTNKDVAGLLNLSPQTVESHRANLMQKLGLHSTADIILYAVRKRIIS